MIVLAFYVLAIFGLSAFVAWADTTIRRFTASAPHLPGAGARVAGSASDQDPAPLWAAWDSEPMRWRP